MVSDLNIIIELDPVTKNEDHILIIVHGRFQRWPRRIPDGEPSNGRIHLFIPPFTIVQQVIRQNSAIGRTLTNRGGKIVCVMSGGRAGMGIFRSDDTALSRRRDQCSGRSVAAAAHQQKPCPEMIKQPPIVAELDRKRGRLASEELGQIGLTLRADLPAQPSSCPINRDSHEIG